MQPFVTAPVHLQIAHVDGGGQTYLKPAAAIITEIIGGSRVGLVVFSNNNVTFTQADFSAEPADGCWNWPPTN